MTSLSEARVQVLADPEALACRVADWLLAAATAKDGIFAVALSGGSTPRRLYEHLAGPPYREAFPWPRTHWFWGDERFVPHDHPDSNYRMAREAMLSRAPVPVANMHPIPTEGIGPQEAAAVYERELAVCYGTPMLKSERRSSTLSCSAWGRKAIPRRSSPGRRSSRSVHGGSER
jgi:6-phosphogluconolactonase